MDVQDHVEHVSTQPQLAPSVSAADQAAEGGQLTAMQALYGRQDVAVQRSIERTAEQRLRDHNLEAFLAFGDGDEAATRATPSTPASFDQDAVWIVRGVLPPETCTLIRNAFDEAAFQRGGWDVDRHRKYPTTDLPLSVVPAAVEAQIREVVFSRIIEPMASFYCGKPSLPEHLEVRDFFCVKYSASSGEQRELQRHADASLFSFNLLLSDPQLDFEGGGTFFENNGWTVRPGEIGTAVVHGGEVFHGGYPIHDGERYILVGFVEMMRGHAYCVSESEAAAADAFEKFGHAAWTRNKLGSESNLPERLNEDSKEVCFLERS